MVHYRGDLSIVFGGAAGQGVQTIADALVSLLRTSGYHVSACTEFMSRIRGGSNSTEVRIASCRRNAFVRRIDLLFALNAEVLEHLAERITPETTVFAEKEGRGDIEALRVIDTPLAEFAREAGSPVYANTVAVGVVLGILGIRLEGFRDFLSGQFADKGDDVVERNHKAADLGFRFGREAAERESLSVTLPAPEEKLGALLLNGTQALGIGAVSAGCSFISSYPMSPGTGLLTFLAAHGPRFSIVVDQAEDEIAAINAGLGASYAGARALVTTSGGGFALMGEGISLAGIAEQPVVVHIGQRPGPATGMPTRTEQGDLNLVLYAGHGDFARAVYAPGTLEEAILVMQRAFETADRYQVPVFVLTDQFFLDSVMTMPKESVPDLSLDRCIVRSDAGYQRYRFTADGVSPRSVPGHGDGVVKVDSHEHDESGHLTENFSIRERMVSKRLQRLEEMKQQAIRPSWYGNPSASTVVVSWGSNRGVVEEALDLLQHDDNIASLHFSQLYPLHADAQTLLEGRHVVVVENNATGQFADFLHREYGIVAARRVLKAIGEPFAVEDIMNVLQTSGGEA
ncbi:MAG TPA: 2-oxoacid:acceptor oxidoreductase subunit alpha [Prosthecochloris aestuarii]|uniref:2-oxoacid:acceptor oxidoreductase subunit alpha n=1 Tax=Prosthecochloris aestuarii TaxID=1102 RepID=A0A831WSK1_PROAE|nr:2-oxoacid:acceptor oxidoreductase subunit alpha [Prosthecochloris aestuarii]